jgi:Fe-S-cluster containining protein
VSSGEAARISGAEALHDASGMPILTRKRLVTEEVKHPCRFLDPIKRCPVYESRPAICGPYPICLASLKTKGHEAPEDVYVLVREPRFKGHDEIKEQIVAGYRTEQSVEPCDEANRDWIHILLEFRDAALVTPARPQKK